MRTIIPIQVGALASPRWSRDEGWTLLEALLSIVLISVVFLGFTVSLIGMREIFNRAWALRTLDQYAINFADYFRSYLRQGILLEQNPNQPFGLGSFRVLKPLYHFDIMPFWSELHEFDFATSPNSGVVIGQNNASPQPYDEDFTQPGWSAKHIFSFVEFHQEPWLEAYRPAYFNNAMGRIKFTLRYERPRTLEGPGGIFGATAVIEKTYTVTGFMKNYLNQPSQ